MSLDTACEAMRVICTTVTDDAVPNIPVTNTVNNPVGRSEVDIPGDLQEGELPACIVRGIKTIEKPQSTGYHKETHTILVEYLDAPEASANQQEALRRARVWLENAKHNLRRNRFLRVSGVENGLLQQEIISEYDAPYSDTDSTRILIHCQMQVEVLDHLIPRT